MRASCVSPATRRGVGASGGSSRRSWLATDVLLRREEDRVLLAAIRLHLAAVRVGLPHPEPELNVDAPAETPDPADLHAREEPLAEKDGRGEAGVDDADAVSAPAIADQPGAVRCDHARLARERDRQLAGQMVRPRRRDPLRANTRIGERDGLLEHERPPVLADERVEERRGLRDSIELLARDADRRTLAMLHGCRLALRTSRRHAACSPGSRRAR